MARQSHNHFVHLVKPPPCTNSVCCDHKPTERVPNETKQSHNKLPKQTPLKSVRAFKKEWKTLKQVGWGAQGSIFQLKALNNNYTNCIQHIEYVAKIIYFTDQNIYESVEDRQIAVLSVMNEYKLVANGHLLHYIDFYYDTYNYTKAIIVMEKLSHCLSSKRDSNWNGIFCIKKIARDIAHNIKQIHDLEYAHLDIKKENIMYNEREMKWKLIDYGFSQYIDPNKKCISVKEFIGTKAWTAPEIKLRSESCDEPNIVSKKCDIYSYGLVVLNLALGGYHYRVFVKQSNLSAEYDLEILRMLNTKNGNVLLQRYLTSLNDNGVIDKDLYVFLSKILVYDPWKRPDIDGILKMDYLLCIENE